MILLKLIQLVLVFYMNFAIKCGINVYTARVAQLVERWTFNPTVQGSSPFPGGCELFFIIIISKVLKDR